MMRHKRKTIPKSPLKELGTCHKLLFYNSYICVEPVYYAYYEFYFIKSLQFGHFLKGDFWGMASRSLDVFIFVLLEGYVRLRQFLG